MTLLLNDAPQEIQVYAVALDGRLAHAAPYVFYPLRSLEEQCRAYELAWRQWRRRYLSDAFPRNARGVRFRNVRKDRFPLCDVPQGDLWRLVSLETGAFLTEVAI